jgi:peroxiredoxin
VLCRELAIQLRRDVKPQLDAAGVKLFLVSIGTWERSIEFAEVTGFPRESLLADPESVTYEALGLVKGVRQTFFAKEVRGLGLGTARCGAVRRGALGGGRT